jgi:hypothetical protein
LAANAVIVFTDHLQDGKMLSFLRRIWKAKNASWYAPKGERSPLGLTFRQSPLVRADEVIEKLAGCCGA